MKRGKKLFAILLSLAMVVTMMPAFTLTAGAYPIKSWELVGGTIYASQLEEGAFLSLESDTTLVLDADIGLGSISGDKKLTIKDSGSHKLQVINDSGNAIVTKEVLIEGGTVEAVGNGTNTRGIATYGGNLTIKSAKVSAKGDAHGIIAANANILIEDSEVAAEGGSGEQDTGMEAYWGDSITIRNSLVIAVGGRHGLYAMGSNDTGGYITAENSDVIAGGAKGALQGIVKMSGYDPSPIVEISTSSTTGADTTGWDGVSKLTDSAILYVKISTGTISDVYFNYTVPKAGNKAALPTSYSGAMIQSFTWYRKVLTERGIEDWEAMPMGSEFKAGKKYLLRIEAKPFKSFFSTGTSMRVILNGVKEPLIIKELTRSYMRIEKEYTVEEELINPFVDVYKSDDYYDAVLWAYYADPQVTNGIDATHFGPKNTVKRCESVTFLWRAMGKPKPSSYANPFKDVKPDDYFYEPVLWAVEEGITNGTTATTFSPNDKLTTAHMITFLYRAKTGKAGQGWYEEAADWAGNGYGGRPFGVNTAVNNSTDCPRGYVVMFLQKAK